MEQITNNCRNCATCVYWLGERAPNRLGLVEVSSKMAKGRCGKLILTDKREFQAIYCCSNYSKWPVLR